MDDQFEGLEQLRQSGALDEAAYQTARARLEARETKPAPIVYDPPPALPNATAYAAASAAGWYADPHGQAPLRWWDGGQWTQNISDASVSAPSQSRSLTIIAIWALIVIGSGLALFTSVSLLSGTTTVWFGVALVIVGVIVAFVTHHVGTATKIIAIVLVLLCVSNAVYDEVQLQHKRDQLNNLFNGN